jgi:heme exporter protein A
MQARLSATDLACRRGDRLLFAGLSLDLVPGMALQLTRLNGVGKSSLMRICAGLARPWAGSVTREGAVALVDERPALDPDWALGRALAFWAAIDGTDLSGAVERLGLATLLEVPVRYLSTGQKKRAALARLLGQQAPIWLLDEPLNGLDAAAATLVEQLAGEHCAAGGIALIASHQSFTLPGMARLELDQFAPKATLQ